MTMPFLDRAQRSAGSARTPAFALATVVLGSLALALAAHIKVPFWPVPITMQTFVVLLLGALAGPRLAGATVLAYLVEGAAGLPVFASGAGPAYLLGPTGGFLVGYVFAAALTGVAAERGFTRSVGGAVATFLVADALIFAFGVGWLSMLMGGRRAIEAGLTPFLLGECLKIALATAVTQVWYRRAR